MYRLYRPILFVATLMLGLLIFTAQQSLQAAPLAQEGDPVIVAAGDIVECGNDNHYYTAYLLESIDGTILTLGDAVYEIGSPQEFAGCYDGSWGRFKDRTRPTPGNHEYGSQGAGGYYSYFGDAATPLEPGCTRDCKGYYSYDLGDWHIVALNSEIDNLAGSEQVQWLRADLAANPTACTLVYWHRPRFSSAGHGDAAHDLYQAAYDYGADVLLSGHDHSYERFSPQDPGGQYDPDHGLRQFVVGTGGAEFDDFSFIQPNSEARESETWGVLKMTLHSDSYSWEFLPVPGETFTDSGTANCVTPANPPADLAQARVTQVADTAAVTNGTAETAATETAPASNTSVSNTSVSNTSAATSTAANSGSYTIESGDTLFAIALRFDLAWTTLAEANDLSEDSILQIGQVLTVPGAGTASAPAATAQSVSAVGSSSAVTTTTSVTGTTASAVATTGSTSAATPATGATTASASGADTHTVQSGETIILIALANGLDWRDLLALNGLEEESILQIGQEIVLR